MYIYGNGMYFPLQWWLQVLSCIVFSIIGFSGSLKKVDNSKHIKKASDL